MEFLEKICTEYITTHILYFVGLANCVHACIKLSGYVVVTCLLFRKSHARSPLISWNLYLWMKLYRTKVYIVLLVPWNMDVVFIWYVCLQIRLRGINQSICSGLYFVAAIQYGVYDKREYFLQKNNNNKREYDHICRRRGLIIW